MGARGEETIVIGEKEISVLFTNRALAEAEGKLGESVTVTAGKLASGDVSMNTLAELLRCGMQAAARDAGETSRVSINEAFDVLDGAGFTFVLEKVATAMTGCLSYDTRQ